MLLVSQLVHSLFGADCRRLSSRLLGTLCMNCSDSAAGALALTALAVLANEHKITWPLLGLLLMENELTVNF